MLIGYARISKADGTQVLDLQNDALIAAGVNKKNIYQDEASGKRDDRPGLQSCLKALREGDILVVWKLDRLGPAQSFNQYSSRFGRSWGGLSSTDRKGCRN